MDAARSRRQGVWSAVRECVSMQKGGVWRWVVRYSSAQVAAGARERRAWWWRGNGRTHQTDETEGTVLNCKRRARSGAAYVYEMFQ